MQIVQSDIALGEVTRNIALMLEGNAARYSNRTMYGEKRNGEYRHTTWAEFLHSVRNVASNLARYGYQPGSKVMVYSPNRLEMLILEMAVMASGGISVPIFAYFQKETVEILLNHSDCSFVAVAGELQLSRLPQHANIKHVFVFDHLETLPYPNCVLFSELLADHGSEPGALLTNAPADDICLNMYTSGTMGVPKCVQLTHRNILSQQAALQHVWHLNEDDRLLAYLPWHHSFGGIFERFSALYNGAALMLESSYGKDPGQIMENWKQVKPSCFFSVPKVYQSLIELTRGDKDAEQLFFHSGLKFVFTAAASLPETLSVEFEKRNIPVLEGWGLTETSPCCTITDPTLKREKGIVGKPIPGVSIGIADDGEICVKGPNVMVGYYKNDDANEKAFTADGWYCTGDVGELTPGGLKLVSRKDRIFKLANGEKVIPSDLEMLIQNKCSYVAYAVIVGGGKEYPVALLFPNRNELSQPTGAVASTEGCKCPRSINELGNCLHTCLRQTNYSLLQKFAKIKFAMVIDDELSIERNTLTPSLKFAPNKIQEAYKAHIENLYGAKNSISEEVYIVNLTADNPFIPETT